MKQFGNAIIKILKYIGQAIKLVFVFIINFLSFIINNTFGLIFSKKMTPFNNPKQNDEDFPNLKIFRNTVLIILLLAIIFSFQLIYKYTLGLLFTFTFEGIGKILGVIFGSQNIYSAVLIEYGSYFSTGIGYTLYLSLIGTTIGFILSLGVGLVLTFKSNALDSKFITYVKKISKAIARTYVTIMRGTPMMVQAMIVFFGILGPLHWEPASAGLIVVSLNTTAYLAEVVRGAIESIDKGQSEGALSLGLNTFQTMIYVVFPQAVKNSMASIGNEFVINIKDTSVFTLIGVMDLFYFAKKADAGYVKPFEIYILIALIYLFLTSMLTLILRAVEKKTDLPTVALPSSN